MDDYEEKLYDRIMERLDKIIELLENISRGTPAKCNHCKGTGFARNGMDGYESRCCSCGGTGCDK